MIKRYSTLYKCEIQGCDTCPFWRIREGGTCVGCSGGERLCPAEENGKGCLLGVAREE